MSLVNIVNMAVLDNPSSFLNPLQFEITFDCMEALEEDIEWKVIYVGSAESSSHDQVLDELLVGPVPVGTNKFILQTDAPDPTLIPASDVLGITVILVTCSYKEQEFARVGYYVNNEYRPFEGYNPEEHGEPDLQNLDLTKVWRTLFADKPRVTRFPIQWTSEVKTESSEMGENKNKEEEDCMTSTNDNNENNISMTDALTDMEQFKSPKRSGALREQHFVSPDGPGPTDMIMSM